MRKWKYSEHPEALCSANLTAPIISHCMVLELFNVILLFIYYIKK